MRETRQRTKKLNTLRHRTTNQKQAGAVRTTTTSSSSSSSYSYSYSSMVTDSATDSDDSAGNRRRVTDISKSKPKFSDGEKVLAYHGPRIYEAKVQKSEIKKKEWKYFVHYLGWSKTWDEWVGADRLMKYTNDNIQKQQALDKKQGVEKNPKSGRSNHMKPKISNDLKVDKEDVKTSGISSKLKSDVLIMGPKVKKRKNDSSTEKGSASIEKFVNIEIPSSLKQQLVDDWVFVNVQDKLVNIPRSPNIDDIFAKYLEHMSKKDAMMTDSVGEILKGLRCYFDRALPVILLYDKERQQYRDNVSDDVSPSSIYGAEHLLRLFVKLPELLPYVNIEEDLVVHLQRKFLDFLKFLQKNQSSYFLSSYEDSKASEASVARDKTARE